MSAGLLERPNISFSSSVSVSLALQTSQLFRGLSFTITCSVQPQYPGGTFFLTVPWSNRSHAHPAVNHSASFFFPAADQSHQGNYSCVYYNQINFSGYNRRVNATALYNFSSESELLSFTVTGMYTLNDDDYLILDLMTTLFAYQERNLPVRVRLDSVLYGEIIRMVLTAVYFLIFWFIFLIFKKRGALLLTRSSGE